MTRRARLIAIVTAVLSLLSLASPAAADPVTGIEKELGDKFHDLEGVIEDYNAITIAFGETKTKIAALEKELKPFEDQLTVLYQRAGDIAGQAYMGGKMNGVTALLDSGAPDVLADRMTLLDQITSADAVVINELNAAKADLDERKAVLDGLYAEQSGRESELGGKKQGIEQDLERLQGEREKAYRDSRGLRPDDFVPPYVPGDRGTVVDFALAQVGKPYVWAAAGPDGFDCSGLTLRAWSKVGLSLPHNAEAQWNMLPHIPRDQLQPGDLVFFNDLTHVAMYIGNGYVVQAAINFNNVKIETIESAASDYYGAARIPGY